MAVRTRNPEAKREAILAAALAVFVEQGYHAAKTSAVAQRADVAEGTIFRIFGTKEALGNAVYLMCAGQYAELLSLAIGTAKAKPRDQFRALFQAMARFQRDSPAAFAFFELHSHRDYLDDTGRLARAQHKAAVFALIKRWQAESALRDESHEVLRALVIGAFARLVRESSEGGFPLTAALVDGLERVCWDAVAARGARGR